MRAFLGLENLHFKAKKERKDTENRREAAEGKRKGTQHKKFFKPRQKRCFKPGKHTRTMFNIWLSTIDC